MKRILVAVLAVAALTASCGTNDEPTAVAQGPTTTVPESRTSTAVIATPPVTALATTHQNLSDSASRVYFDTCNELLPIFSARAELGGNNESQAEFAEAMLAQLKQSPEWATKTSADQGDATRGVYAAAAGEC
ncbi:hypothetical protein [Rhodococcus erythropolis]|uniref:hypothetical protein n=1 Tax=Rhodococcus erythropolis TaxID=1833 RepID=UPI00366E5415